MTMSSQHLVDAASVVKQLAISYCLGRISFQDYKAECSKVLQELPSPRTVRDEYFLELTAMGKLNQKDC